MTLPSKLYAKAWGDRYLVKTERQAIVARVSVRDFVNRAAARQFVTALCTAYNSIKDYIDEQAGKDRSQRCQHVWAHRNDGKISFCRKCGAVRDNEP